MAEQVNEAAPHTAAVSLAKLKDLLRQESADERLAYYKDVVRTEHLHDSTTLLRWAPRTLRSRAPSSSRAP